MQVTMTGPQPKPNLTPKPNPKPNPKPVYNPGNPIRRGLDTPIIKK